MEFILGTRKPLPPSPCLPQPRARHPRRDEGWACVGAHVQGSARRVRAGYRDLTSSLQHDTLLDQKSIRSRHPTSSG